MSRRIDPVKELVMEDSPPFDFSRLSKTLQGVTKDTFPQGVLPAQQVGGQVDQKGLDRTLPKDLDKVVLPSLSDLSSSLEMPVGRQLPESFPAGGSGVGNLLPRMPSEQERSESELESGL